mmetsp:Transcript_10307/g.18643  ORF Transcript_10307/g.18643 Transcript_10307/m.18643 type:complete len:103 (-) Transcript_10307:61-369(-)
MVIALLLLITFSITFMAATGRATSEWEGEDMKERRSFRTISMKGEESEVHSVCASVRDDIGKDTHSFWVWRYTTYDTDTDTDTILTLILTSWRATERLTTTV